MAKRKKDIKFPEGFLWGAATSAYQVEGGIENDWSEWEKKNAQRLAKEAEAYWQPWQIKKFPEMLKSENYICGKACDHYNLFEEDLDIAQSLSLNSFRISIEWSRIEPKEGEFDEKEVEHYRKVIRAIHKRGMQPLITLCHYTLPGWLADKRGLLCNNFPYYFTRYAVFIENRFGNINNLWITFNEPTVLIGFAYLAGKWPPRKKNPIFALRALKNIAEAHNRAYDIIHKHSKGAKIGLSHLIRYFEPYNKNSILDKFAVGIANRYRNNKLYKLTQGKHDFLALQYYFRTKLKFPISERNENRKVTDLGWEIYPEGIYHILKDLKKYNLPIYITENGLADADDSKRLGFIKNHLYWIYRAIGDGADVRGYFHWSFLDNFEWDKGFWPRFGLVRVDYKTMRRKIRSSAFKFKIICETNTLSL